jgi:spore coat protein U-like protein
MGKSLKIILPKTAFVNRKEQKMKTKLNQNKLKLAIVSAMLVGSAGLSTAGHAATVDTTTMAVSTSVAMSCNISATPSLNFSVYDPNSLNDNLATAAIVSTCTIGGSAIITLGQSLDPVSASTDAVPIRRMEGSSADNTGTFLAYSLYKDSTRSTNWGNTPTTGLSFTAIDSGITNSIVYGKIAKGLPALNGVFGDTISVTLTY